MTMLCAPSPAVHGLLLQYFQIVQHAWCASHTCTKLGMHMHPVNDVPCLYVHMHASLPIHSTLLTGCGLPGCAARAGDFPLVRVTAHPPLESLLQPGGTVGVLLDFRVAHGPESDPDQQPRCLQVGCCVLVVCKGCVTQLYLSCGLVVI